MRYSIDLNKATESQNFFQHIFSVSFQIATQSTDANHRITTEINAQTQSWWLRIYISYYTHQHIPSTEVTSSRYLVARPFHLRSLQYFVDEARCVSTEFSPLIKRPPTPFSEVCYWSICEEILANECTMPLGRRSFTAHSVALHGSWPDSSWSFNCVECVLLVLTKIPTKMEHCCDSTMLKSTLNFRMKDVLW